MFEGEKLPVNVELLLTGVELKLLGKVTLWFFVGWFVLLDCKYWLFRAFGIYRGTL